MPPLTGVRVLDLSNVLAGPFCSYHLARLGAEVIKIERPGEGDLSRQLGVDREMSGRLQGLSFLAANAAKQSVLADLKSASGRDFFLRMVDGADVILESFRPGVMDRLSLSYAQLIARNPGLVYCSISGFGRDGPWAHRPAYDQIVQGLSGAMSITGTKKSGPFRTGYPVADTTGGMAAAFAIAAALVRQRVSGEGEYIDVSMLECMLASMGWIISNFLNGGVQPEPMGNQNFTAAPSGTFRCAEGLLNIAANEQHQFEALCRAIDCEGLIEDDQYKCRNQRKRNRAALNHEIESALAAKNAIDWEIALTRAGVPAGRIETVGEILASPQVQERAFLETLDVDLPNGNSARVTRPGFRLSEPFAKPSPPPGLGAHTQVWMERVGYSSAEIGSYLSEVANLP